MADQPRKWLYWATLVLILVCLVLPIALHWLLFQRFPSITPDLAQKRLAAGEAVLIDIRTPEEFDVEHIEGSVNWPYGDLLDDVASCPVPIEEQGKALVLICDSGLLSAAAVRHLQPEYKELVQHVEGGISAWIASASGAPDTDACRLRSASSAVVDPYRESPAHEQWAAFLSGFIIKPLYMLISLILIIILRKRVKRDLVALRWSMVAFLVGEGFCALNYLAFTEQSDLMEYLHSYGMVCSFGFAVYAIMAAVDDRIVHFSNEEKRCAMLSLCGQCIKQKAVPCGLIRTFIIAIPATIILAFLPLSVQTQMVSYNTTILESPYNYSHAGIHQLFEVRYCPAIAIILSAIALIILIARYEKGIAAAKFFYAAAVGALGFGFMRLLLFAPFQDNLVWFAFWEEATELLFILGVVGVLWIFRKRLFADMAEKEELSQPAA